MIGELQPDVVVPLGDTQYERGGPDEYAEYDGSWGGYLDRTWPVVGNHEWQTPGAQGFLSYFASRVAGQSYYAVELTPEWRLIVLDSNCVSIGGCGHGSAQYEWLRQVLTAHDGISVVAAWHHPRWSSGRHAPEMLVDPFWDMLVADDDVQVVLTAHVHAYERFAPMGSGVSVDPAGLRQFVVGTGGREHQCERRSVGDGSEVFNCDTFGLLELTLRTGGWDWAFVPAPGAGTFTDHGSAPLRG